MKAMILAAGLGTRLKPITDTMPKAMVKVGGIPMIGIILRQLKKQGFHEVIINLHYLAGQITEYIEKNNDFGLSIQYSDERDQLLDTGGAIKKASWFLDNDQPFLLHNVDEITDIDLRALFRHHRNRSALVTLAVKKTDLPQGLLFDPEMNLSGWENRDSHQKEVIAAKRDQSLNHFGFCGIHVINPEIFRLMDEKGKFPIIPFYLDLMEKGHRIIGYHAENNLWIDIGSPDQLKEANNTDPDLYL